MEWVKGGRRIREQQKGLKGRKSKREREREKEEERGGEEESKR